MIRALMKAIFEEMNLWKIDGKVNNLKNYKLKEKEPHRI
jgi:hypothetical protein